MSGLTVPMAALAALGVSAGGLVAWVTAAPSSDADGTTSSAAADRDVTAPPETGREPHDEHGHPVHDLHLVDPDPAPPPGRATDVWLDEPPLGPLPTGPPPVAETSEDAVVGYLTAAHTVTSADADLRHRRHHGWLHPAAPGRTGGVWTDDPPPEGITRTVEIVEIDLHAAAEAGAAWRVVYRLWDADVVHAERTRYVATRRGPDGRWLVVTETLDLDPVAH